MELFDLLLQSGLITSALVVYLLFYSRPVRRKGNYVQPGWNYPLKLLLAQYYAVKRWKAKYKVVKPLQEMPLTDSNRGWDSLAVRATASDGDGSLLIAMRKLNTQQGPIAEIILHLKLNDGTTYTLPEHPDTAIGYWSHSPNSWSAGGLKIQILEAKNRMRILFNGLLTRDADKTVQHVRLNLIWVSATEAIHHPKDWSDELAAQALALETWRDGNWPNLLGRHLEGGWVQFGAIQGAFQSYDSKGALDMSNYIRFRGVRERTWAPKGYNGLRRSVNIMVSTVDGIVVKLKAVSYKNVLTQCISGSVRFPNYRFGSITSTDIDLSSFCETYDDIPKSLTINIGTKNRNLRLVMRINSDGGKFFSGIPYQQEVIFRTITATIDDAHGTGILELGYEQIGSSIKPATIAPAPVLKWISEEYAGDVGYCIFLEKKAAGCPNYVGGKSASLALLTSLQKSEGYRVPPGFCLTVRALEKQLEANPEIKLAVLEIEKANFNYDEQVFKGLCNIASEKFTNVEITKDVKEDILQHLKILRQKANEENLGPELRFAVRSSAVGEDGETLSAAGQNDTILGCHTDADVLKGIQKCWGSMFAFTSAYYRRQNGQKCLVGGGVVIQALVSPRVAGVLFTRHPDAGDPSRLLITANYGLGESVVSGSVEPDTIIVNRKSDGNLVIANVTLGAKTQRVTASGHGTAIVDVSEAERNVSCLTDSEILRLAQLGVAQDELWGAGRDIEWAICDNNIFLLQARPITSLERWTEEELLHEMDTAIMADDELISFANVGEVLPKALTALTHDILLNTLMDTMNSIMETDNEYDNGMQVTHQRACMSLYNTIYRNMANKIDLQTRMTEMAIHGHKIADEGILNTATRRNKRSFWYNLSMMRLLFKTLLTTKWILNDTVKTVNKICFDTVNQSIKELFDTLCSKKQILREVMLNHMRTTVGSSGSQFIAMSVLLEGGSDFTMEQSNEICVLFSSGDTMSGEVPQALAKLAKELDASGRIDDFKAQDPKSAMNWLRKNLPNIHLEVTTFLEKHGYRAYMEFDFHTKPWLLAPEELMQLLQTIRPNNEEQAKSKSDSEVIKSLKTPKKSSTRKILQWVLPLCRRSVTHREGTKAQMILAIHKFRLVLIALGKLMVKEWYLPDYELIFFFRLHELKEYIEARDPALLRKAMQRRQYYPRWCQYKFKELNTGWPEPIKAVAPSLIAGDVKIVGTSVCAGEVIARACVVKEFSEVHQLQQGDVLITHSTDIGWSPYFPLLSGIVTELGGLISHGAVIAREYGLPCVVAATSATDLFRTGDTVRLSGSTGVIEKIELQNPLDTDENNIDMVN